MDGLRLVVVERFDPDLRERVMHLWVQLGGRRHELRAPGPLARLAHEAAVGPADVEHRAPGLDLAALGHGLR